MAVQFVFPGQQRVDANGDPLASHRLYFYEPGTTTPKDVYSDDELSVAISQPVTADASGVWQRIYCNGKYKVVRANASGTAVETWDDFDPGLSTALGSSEALPVSGGGTGATTAAAARNNLGAASQASVTTNTSNITELQTQVATGLNGDDEFGDLAAKDTVEVSDLAADYGVVILQEIVNTTVLDSTISTATPAYDSSIPQISEGDEVFSQAVTPVSASSILEIEVYVQGEPANSTNVVMALFVDATANAVAADAFRAIATSVPASGFLHYRVASGSTSARTYSMRMGAISQVFTIGGVATLGGVRGSYMKITEKLEV